MLKKLFLAWVLFVFTRSVFAVPALGADPYREKSWHLDSIGAPVAWKTTLGSPDSVIAIVDSGVNASDPDLGPNMWINPDEVPADGIDNDGNGFVDDIHGWDWVKSGPVMVDKSGHGTFIGGIAAAVSGNGIGGVGVCPGCRVMSLRFINWEGLGDTEDAIEGILYAARKKAKVMNLSFSGEGYDKSLRAALEYALKQDVVVVAAASNDGENLDHQSVYPAKFKMDHLISVAAHTEKNDLWEWSNWGKKTVHLAAPGTGIFGPYLKGWETGDGTSMAAGVVSGAVGLLRSANPKLSAPQIKKILLATVRGAPGFEEKLVSAGALDVAAAMKCVMDPALSCLNDPVRRRR